MKTNISENAKVVLWNMFNEETCKLADKINELHSRGAHSAANRQQTLLDELDEIAKQLGIIE